MTMGEMTPAQRREQSKIACAAVQAHVDEMIAAVMGASRQDQQLIAAAPALAAALKNLYQAVDDSNWDTPDPRVLDMLQPARDALKKAGL